MHEAIFLPAEFSAKPAHRLAGIFAAKEAVCKALSLSPGRWLDIVIEHEASGAPQVLLLGSLPQPQELSISISHDGDYAMAFAVALLP